MKKGMTMAMQLLITAIVLVLTALTVLLIVQSKIIGGTNQTQKGADRNLCYANRNVYCQEKPAGCWNSSEALVRGQNCATILGRNQKETLYNCNTGKWYNSTQYDQILSGAISVVCGVKEA